MLIGSRGLPRYFTLVLGVFSALVLASLHTQGQGKREDAPVATAPITWSDYSLVDLEKAVTTGHHVTNVLYQLPPRRGVPLAWQYVYSLAEVSRLQDLEGKHFSRLSGSIPFWATMCYLLEADCSHEPCKWIAEVWRAAVKLPEDYRIEGALFDAGRGDLLRLLFADNVSLAKAPLRWVLAPLPFDAQNTGDLAHLWDYFTAYGGDPSIDPVVELDMFAAALDLDPSYRAKWRNSDLLMRCEKEFKSWDVSAQWKFTASAVDHRIAKKEDYERVRTSILEGKVELSKSMFDD